eukprot:jgi/Picsp_1/4818/NSC_02186-R1_nadh dehydrogenase
MVPSWVEAVLPLGIIAVMVTAMGGLQDGVHRLYYGKPKLVAADAFDKKLMQRDEEITRTE